MSRLDIDDEVTLSNMAAGLVAGYAIIVKRSGEKLAHMNEIYEQATQQIVTLSKQVMEMTAEKTSLEKRLAEFASKVDVEIQIKGTNYVERAALKPCGVFILSDSRVCGGKATQLFIGGAELGFAVCREHIGLRFSDAGAP